MKFTLDNRQFVLCLYITRLKIEKNNLARRDVGHKIKLKNNA